MSESRGRKPRGEARPAELAPVDIATVTAKALGVDPGRYDGVNADERAELLGRIRDIDALIAAWQGEMNRTIAALAPRPARSYRAENAVIDEVCAARRVGSWTAGRALASARLCAGPDAPAAIVQEALLAGAASPKHLDDFVAITESITDDVLSPDEQAEGLTARSRADKLAEVATGTTTSLLLDTPTRYRQVVEAAVTRIDGQAETERRRAAQRRRDVFTGRRLDDPLASLTLLDDPSLVGRIMTRLQTRARRLQLSRGGRRAVGTCPDARIGACRADVLVDLLDQLTAEDPDLPDGCETGPLPDDTQVEPLPADTSARARSPQREGFLVIDLATLRGERDNPCLLDGHPVPAAMGRAAAGCVKRWRRMVTDPVTGHLLDYGHAVYLPSPLTDFVRQRDGRCIVPYCERPARACQVDHGVPHPKGPSSSVNCGLLCDRHHPLKTEGYEHLILDEASGWVQHRTAWGQVLDACGHPYLPDWDDEPYDVITQTHPGRGDPPDRADADDTHDPDPPPEPEPPPAPKRARPKTTHHPSDAARERLSNCGHVRRRHPRGSGRVTARELGSGLARGRGEDSRDGWESTSSYRSVRSPARSSSSNAAVTVVDTNVLSEVMRPTAEPAVVEPHRGRAHQAHQERRHGARLFESPNTDRAPTGPDYVFPAADVEVIVGTLQHSRQTVVPAATAS